MWNFLLVPQYVLPARRNLLEKDEVLSKQHWRMKYSDFEEVYTIIIISPTCFHLNRWENMNISKIYKPTEVLMYIGAEIINVC